MTSDLNANTERLGEQLYDALKEVQMALFHGEDENDEQIEAALQAWERRNLPARIDGTTHAHYALNSPQLREAHLRVDQTQSHYHPGQPSWDSISNAELIDGRGDG